MSSRNRNAPRAAGAKLTPANLTADFELARRHCEAGEFAAAESLCREMLKKAAAHPNATLMLGQIMWAQGRHEDAIAILAPLVARHPDFAAAHFSLGNALHSAGRYAEAAAHLRRAIALKPQDAAGHNNLGLALENLGDCDAAIRAYERALSLQPDLATARVNLGIALLNSGNPEAAIVHLKRAAALLPATKNVDLFLGRALHKSGREAEALPCYERAVAFDPKLTAGWVGLGSVLRALGHFAEAAGAFEKALAINPDHGLARHGLTSLRRRVADTAELDRLRQIMANPAAEADERGAAGMAMAKILDDSGRYDEAFAAALEGNRLARAAQLAANISYNHETFRKRNDALLRVFTPEFFAATRDWGNPSELPAFIVGYYRTGSTLIEQICASHSQIHAVGESHDLPQIAAQVQRIAPEQWTAGLFRPLGDRHVQRLAEVAPGKLRIVDKMLDNIYRLGMIAAMFPRARVIFTHRDGRDAALSVFMQHFGQEVAFATDLLDAGRRWHEAERMCAHWARCLPLAMHHVQYETLISDFEAEARKLIDFLGLPWEPACLEYYKSERAVSTASSWQVRQPLYESSVGRWRNYAKHLRPLCAATGLDPDAPTGARPADIQLPTAQ